MNNETVEDDDMNQTKSELKKVQLYIESFGKSRQGINNKYISQGEKKLNLSGELWVNHTTASCCVCTVLLLLPVV